MPPPMPMGDEMEMGMMGPAAAIAAEDSASPVEGKPASDFDLAADRMFTASTNGDQPGFRSALRSAIKIVINDMKL